MADSYLDKLMRGVEAGQKLQQVLDKRLGTDVAILGDILRATDRAVAISGTFRGQKAVFKQSFLPGARDIAHGLGSVIKTYEAVMDDKSRVNPHLKSFPGQGLTILGHVDGTHPNELFETASDTERDQVILALDDWLRCAARLGQEVCKFNPTSSLNQLGAHRAQLPAGADPDLADRFLGLLHRAADRFSGLKMHKAVGHGDCHSGNFLWDAPILYAIDIEAAVPQPSAKMRGTFLGRLPLRPAHESQMRFGVCARDFDLLAHSTLLLQGEAEATLPFYTACALFLYKTPHSPHAHTRDKQNARWHSALRDLTAMLED